MALYSIVDPNFDPEKEVGPETALCERCEETYTWHPENDAPEVLEVTVKLTARNSWNLGNIKAGELCESCQKEALEAVRDTLFEFIHSNDKREQQWHRKV